MNTGTCLRPSWTAIVWPTISGKITDERDHVLIICFWPDSFICSIRRSRRSSTYGPFLDERDIRCSFPGHRALGGAKDELGKDAGPKPCFQQGEGRGHSRAKSFASPRVQGSGKEHLITSDP